MATAVSIRKLLQPLRDRHADIAIVGRWAFVKPVNHFARGVILDRTSDPKKFMPRWAIMHLFNAQNDIRLNWSGAVYDRGASVDNYWDRSETEISEDLCNQIERSTLPLLRRIDSFQAYLELVATHYFGFKLFDWPEENIIVDVALGDINKALAAWKDNELAWNPDSPSIHPSGKATISRLRQLGGLLEIGDKPALAAMLHEWEAYTVKKLKLDHIWERTPFPLELI